MKRFQIAIATVIIVVFMSTCTASASTYTGFKKPKEGEWTMWSMHLNVRGEKSTMKQKMIYVGEAMINGKKAYGIEMQVENPTIPQMSNIIQFWNTAEDDSPIKMVMLRGGKMMCMSADMPGMGPNKSLLKAPEVYSQKTKPLRFETYTTPTGKKIKAAVYPLAAGEKSDPNAKGESWVSSDIPFGIVKFTENGKITMQLEDFGEDGKVKIPVDKAVKCTPMDLGSMMKGFK